MNAKDYNKLIDALVYGHEFGFRYDGKEYYIERYDQSYRIYDMTDPNNGLLLDEIVDEDINTLIQTLMSRPFIDGKSFNEVYAFIGYVDLD